MRILGIDPALTSLGYGIIESDGPKIRYSHSGLIRTSASTPIHKRLHHITSEISKILELYNPVKIAMEETFMNTNAASSLKLGYVRGALMALFGGNAAPYFEYKPNLIKKTLVGVGHADKDQVIHMIRIVLSGAPDKLSSDEADALAVAYTCLVHSGQGCNQ